ncbi:MAG: hypothetical protein FJ382_01940 [Verrucomicrobia bacterium]|nr:hypothetical protein [Verrucomicrobiota bacterium]
MPHAPDGPHAPGSHIGRGIRGAGSVRGPRNVGSEVVSLRVGHLPGPFRDVSDHANDVLAEGPLGRT